MASHAPVDSLLKVTEKQHSRAVLTHIILAPNWVAPVFNMPIFNSTTALKLNSIDEDQSISNR